MNFKQQILAILLTLGISLSSLAQNQTESTQSDFSDYRYTYEQMYEIASPNKLRHRIFYKPSTGEHAEWFDAVKKGNTKKVVQMVEAGQDIEVKDMDALGQTALGWAAFIGYKDIVEYLISKGANLYATDKADVPHVFKSAVLGNNVEIVKLTYSLLKDEIDLDKQEDDGETFLMVAASNNRIETVKFLLSLGVKMNTVSEPLNRSALSIACERGHRGVVDILIEAGAINHKTNQSNCVTAEQ